MYRIINIKNKKLFFVFIIFILIFNCYFSVYRVFSDSMYPFLDKGDYIISLKTNNINRGDIIVINRENKFLIKRIIAMPGERIDIDKNGNVFINQKYFHEGYVRNKSFNTLDIKLPYKVIDDSYFVMGDKRDSSIDSRFKSIGSIKSNEIKGKVILKIYPFRVVK